MRESGSCFPVWSWALGFVATVLLSGADGALGQAAGIVPGQSIYVAATRATGEVGPFAACPSTNAGSGPMPFPGALLLPAEDKSHPWGLPDHDLREAVKSEFRRQTGLKLVATAEQADLVFVVQGVYAAFFSASVSTPRGPLPPGSSGGFEPFGSPSQAWPDPPRDVGQQRVTLEGTVPDKPPNMLTLALAFAVPATAYLQTRAEPATVFQARIWEGWENLSGRRLGKGMAPGLLADLVRGLVSRTDKIYSRRTTGSRVTAPPHRVCPNPMPLRAGPANTTSLNVPIPAVSSQPAPAPGSASTASGGPPRFRSGVLAVAVPVIATDQDGRNVSGLAASDFHIFEDGAEQPLQHFVEVSEPLNLALLLDTSVSMKERYPDILAAASAFVDRLRPDDRAMVVSFDDRAYLGCEFTADRAEVHAALRRTRIGGRLSQLFDSVETLLSERLDQVEGRKAVVLFTDGVDVGSSFATDRTTIQRVQASNAPVYVVQYDTRRDPQVATMSVRRRGGTTGPESPVMYFDNAGTYSVQTVSWRRSQGKAAALRSGPRRSTRSPPVYRGSPMIFAGSTFWTTTPRRAPMARFTRSASTLPTLPYAFARERAI